MPLGDVHALCTVVLLPLLPEHDGCALTGDDGARPFVALRVRTPRGRAAGVTVLFQRYAAPGTWSTAGNTCLSGESGHFLQRGVVRHALVAFNVGNLLEGRREIIRYANWHDDDMRTTPAWLE